MNDLLFWVLGAILIASSLGVVLARNLWRAAYSLAAALLTTAVFYLLLSAPLVAAVQILVYTGGVLTLVVFALVMTDRPERAVSWRRPVQAAAAAVLVFAALASFALRLTPPDTVPGLPTGNEAAVAVFTTYLVPFELLSLLLLGALFGALVIARKDEAP